MADKVTRGRACPHGGWESACVTADGIEIRSPSGESLLTDPKAASGSAVKLYDATDHLIQFFRYEEDGPPYTTNGIYDVSKRAYLIGEVFPSDLSQTVSSVAMGKLFFHEYTVFDRRPARMPKPSTMRCGTCSTRGPNTILSRWAALNMFRRGADVLIVDSKHQKPR